MRSSNVLWPACPALVSALWLCACVRPPAHQSEIAEQVAERLCSTQNDCGCDPEVIIPSCAHEVEGEITRNERRALEAGLILDELCLETYLANLETLDTCEATLSWSVDDCSVYYGTAGVGDSCLFYELFPPMTNCRQGLECRLGECRDLDNLPILQEGEICSDDQGNVPSGFLGECAAGLVCDSRDTRTCIPAAPTQPIPLGGECPAFTDCELGTYCRPPEGADDVSEENPGICTSPTPVGQPCTLVYECERFCEEGICQAPPPALCELLDDWAGSRELIEHSGG